MEEESIIDGIPQKKSRHRKKLLYSSLKEQMEFYFSDVNISKDRFISKLLEKDPYIDLSVFLQFNKIRRLTDKVSDLYKAISKSEILELSEDNTKVCRKTPINVKENEDECTIYVERLPVDAEHEWLRSIFAKFGPVDYVSIPRYKHNKVIKGFAFIEFSTPETAKKALEYFESIGCKLPTTMLPDQLVSISSFENENILNKFTNEINKDRKSDNINETDNSNVKVKQTKRKHTDENSEDNKNMIEVTEYKEDIKSETLSEEFEESKKKKKKQNLENESENVETTNEDLKPELTETKESKKKKKQNQQLENINIENMETETVEIKEKKKKKNKNQDEPVNSIEESAETVDAEVKNKKKKQKQDTESENTENIDDNLEETDSKAEIESGEKRKRKRKKSKYSNDVQQFGLQVLSKKEWKQLRNKYLNLQRQKMQSLKEHLHRSRYPNVQNNLDSNATENNHNSEVSAPRFEFTPGAIVHITLLDSFVDIKKFKNDIRSQPGLQYVDIKIGTNVGYIRFSDNNSAKKFCESGNVNANMAILEGSEEKQYWDEIMQSREQKFKKESKKQRGRDKLLRKAEKELGKHIKFDAE